MTEIDHLSPNADAVSRWLRELRDARRAKLLGEEFRHPFSETAIGRVITKISSSDKVVIPAVFIGAAVIGLSYGAITGLNILSRRVNRIFSFNIRDKDL